MRFQRKPQFVEAVQYDGTTESIEAIKALCPPGTSVQFQMMLDSDELEPLILGLPGQHTQLNLGNWLVRIGERTYSAKSDHQLHYEYEPAAEA